MYKLYTDGGSKPNPGRGGYGAVLFKNNVEICSVGGGSSDTTNNKMEYEGLKTGLSMSITEVGKNDQFTIFTDSKLVLKQVLNEWKVKDESLLIPCQEVQKLLGYWNCCSLEWVKGHSGVVGNERADQIASFFVQNLSSCVRVDNESNGKIYLDCPFEDKNEAKNLGAKWDPSIKKWYVKDSTGFEKWL